MTVTASQLPISVPIKIVIGDTFRGPIIRHSVGGVPTDTSAWTITGAIYERQACGVTKVIDLTIEKQAGPEFGYRATLTPVQTAGLTCDDNRWYEIVTDDGATVRTYVQGLATISGVG